MPKTSIVTFNQDVYPHCFGDVVELAEDKLKELEEYARRHGIENPFTKGEVVPDRSKIVTPTGDSDAEIERSRAVVTPTPDAVPATSAVTEAESKPAAKEADANKQADTKAPADKPKPKPKDKAQAESKPAE